MFGFGKKKSDDHVEQETTKATLSDGREVSVKEKIDCLGDSCPRPQLMTKKALSGAAPQDIFEVLIDNPSSMEAIPPMMPELGATHLDTIKQRRHWSVFIRKD